MIFLILRVNLFESHILFRILHLYYQQYKKLILLLVNIAGCKCFLTEKNVNKDLFTSQRFVSPVSRF